MFDHTNLFGSSLSDQPNSSSRSGLGGATTTTSSVTSAPQPTTIASVTQPASGTTSSGMATGLAAEPIIEPTTGSTTGPTTRSGFSARPPKRSSLKKIVAISGGLAALVLVTGGTLVATNIVSIPGVGENRSQAVECVDTCENGWCWQSCRSEGSDWQQNGGATEQQLFEQNQASGGTGFEANDGTAGEVHDYSGGGGGGGGDSGGGGGGGGGTSAGGTGGAVQVADPEKAGDDAWNSCKASGGSDAACHDQAATAHQDAKAEIYQQLYEGRTVTTDTGYTISNTNELDQISQVWNYQDRQNQTAGDQIIEGVDYQGQAIKDSETAQQIRDAFSGRTTTTYNQTITNDNPNTKWCATFNCPNGDTTGDSQCNVDDANASMKISRGNTCAQPSSNCGQVDFYSGAVGDWSSFIGAKYHNVTNCGTSGGTTTTTTQTDTVTTTVTGDAFPTLACSSLTSSTAAPVIGDALTFTCAATAQNTTITNYQFQYSIDNGAFTNLGASSTNIAQSLPLTIAQPGAYRVQCRACNVSGSCTTWTTAQ